MPKVKQRKFLAQEKDFLAFPDHYVNIPAKIAYATLDSLASTYSDVYPDEKVILRGTLVNVDGNGVVTKPVEETSAPNAVIFNTIKVSDYDTSDTYVNATVLVHGFVRADRLTELTPGDKTKLDNNLIYVVSA